MPLSGTGVTKLSADIAGMPYVASAAYDLAALQQAISLFTAGSPAGDARLIVWLTDDEDAVRQGGRSFLSKKGGRAETGVLLDHEVQPSEARVRPNENRA